MCCVFFYLRTVRANTITVILLLFFTIIYCIENLYISNYNLKHSMKIIHVIILTAEIGTHSLLTFVKFHDKWDGV